MNLIVLPQRDYLTRRELAERYGIGVRTVDRLVEDGMPVEKWSARLVRFRPSRTDAWMRERSRRRAA